MAVRQYIGARYVPLYVGDWDNTRNYEPLSIVTDANGNSFTSLKDVPAGTALTNRDYWIQTSSFSGAVDQLQRRIGAAEDSITDLSSDIQTLQSDMHQAQIDIDALEEMTSKGAILTIADSYGNATNSSGKTAPSILSDRTNLPVYSYFKGGAGFIDGSLLQGLQTFSTEGHDADIKTIIIFCGANDAYLTAPELVPPKMSELVSYCRTRFPNAENISLCAVGLCMSSMNGSALRRAALVRGYIKGAQQCGINYVENSEYVLHNTALLQDDYVHPNQDGVDLLADALYCAYRKVPCTVHYQLKNLLMTKHANAPAWFNLNAGYLTQTLDNDVLTLSAENFYYGILAFNTGLSAAQIDQTTMYELCTIPDTMIDCIAADPQSAFSINGLFMINGGIPLPGSAKCVIEDKTLKAYFISNSVVGYPIENVVGFVSTDNLVTMPTLYH